MTDQLRTAVQRRLRSERGAFSAMAIVLVGMLLVVAGLVVDGGTVLNARAQTYDDLEQAARVGANQIDEGHLRATGEVVVIPAAAEQQAEAFIWGLPRKDPYATVDAVAGGTQVTVRATRDVSTRLLTLVGVGTIPVRGVATADAQVGIDAPITP